MPTNWPQDAVVDVPSLQARAVRLQAGIVASAERWSSTQVSGSVGGSVYNGTGAVTGSVSSRTTQHQRVYVHFPQTGREAALNLDDWNFDARPGHAVILVVPPQRRRAGEAPVLIHNVSTGRAGPEDRLITGRAARRFARIPAFRLWLSRAVALGLAFAPAAYVELARPAFARRLKESEGHLLAAASVVVLLALLTLPLWRAAKRAHLRRLGRALDEALQPHIDSIAAQVPRAAPPRLAASA